MAEVKFQDLLDTGAHFGHVTRKWHPKYRPYILMEKNGVHIINLDETIAGIERATQFITETVRNNGEILFVGTKKQARDIVQQEADRCSMFYVVERWLGGTLTNFSTIKKSIKRLQLLEKEGSSIYENLTKKEIQMLNRERIKLADQHRGIKDMRRLPDVMVVVDANYEETAVREAKRLEIPIVALVDTNTDPTTIEYPIPANDDSIRTIQLIISTLAECILEVRGQQAGEAEAEAKAEEEAKVEAKVEAKAKAEEEAKVEAKAEAEEEAKVEAKAKAEAEEEAKVEAKAKAKAKAKAEEEVKAEAKAEEEAKVEAEAKAEVEEEVKAESEVETAEVKVEEEVKAEAVEDVKEEVSEDPVEESESK